MLHLSNAAFSFRFLEEEEKKFFSLKWSVGVLALFTYVMAWWYFYHCQECFSVVYRALLLQLIVFLYLSILPSFRFRIRLSSLLDKGKVNFLFFWDAWYVEKRASHSSVKMLSSAYRLSPFLLRHHPSNIKKWFIFYMNWFHMFIQSSVVWIGFFLHSK